MKIDLAIANTALEEIVEIADQLLVGAGFEREGKDGYDEIGGTETALYYMRDNRVLVGISLDLPKRVEIRFSERAKTFSSEANEIFEELAAEFDRAWPGSVLKEPLPTP